MDELAKLRREAGEGEPSGNRRRKREKGEEEEKKEGEKEEKLERKELGQEGRKRSKKENAASEGPQSGFWFNRAGPRSSSEEARPAKVAKEDEEEKERQQLAVRELLGRELRGQQPRKQSLGGGVSGEAQSEGNCSASARALTLATVKEMQKQLLTTSGAVWETSKGSVQPVALQYYRSQLVSKLSGGAAREGLTLSWALDLALQGQVAELADCLAQRLKSVEMTASGSSWMVSQRVEVVPLEKGSLSTRAETQEAAKETKEELKVKGMTKGREKGKNEAPGSSWRTGPKGEGKGKDKGKNKKGGEREERRKDS